MRRWIFLLLAMLLVINLISMGVGCQSKAPEQPKEEVKPAEAPAPAAPEATPAPAPAAPEAAPK
jgi:hypothetical protein